MQADKPLTGLVIRPANLNSDRQALLAIFREADAYHVRKVPYAFRQYECDEDALLERISHAPNPFLFCAELEGLVVGFVLFYVRESPPHPMFVPRRFLMIDSIAVLETYRGRGIGTALMEVVEEKARELGVDDIRLHVWEANEDALGFYRSLGYGTMSRNMLLRLGE